MNKSIQPNKTVASKSIKAPNSNLQPPLILPHASPHQGSSQDVAGPRSFVTQTWTIPDRPKPGRKPKQKPCPESKQQTHQSQQDGVYIDGHAINSTIKDKPPSVIQLEPTKKAKALDTITSTGALQQAYINSLEAKVQSLQSQESEQVNYYKTLASQSNSKIDKIQNENDVLQSQIKILRGEVLRLRKRISQLVKKSAPDNQQKPIVVEFEESPSKESKVRKQVSYPDVDSTCSLERPAASVKKLRRPSVPDEMNEPQPTVVTLPETFNSPQIPSGISVVENTVALATVSNNPSTKRVPDFTSSDIYCGLCTSELDCVCRQVGLKPPLQSVNLSAKDLGNNPLAVPIRRRAQPSTSSVWRIVTADDSVPPLAASPEMEPEPVLQRECNGNPKDCPACRDDPFGQAFCAALNQATATQEPRSNPEATTETATGAGSRATRGMQRSDPIVDAYMSIPCCGDPELCGSQNCFDNAPSPTPVENERKVSCSEAWRQLKAHPNIGLANLQLLADVVARKSAPHSSSSSSIDQNASSIYHQQGHPHEGESNSSWPSSQSMLENEDSIFSPHVTLSTVFENTHNDFDDEDHSYHHQQQRENTSLSSKDSLNNNHLSSFDGAFSHHRQQQQHDLSSSNETHPSSGKKVKFVEKESLDQALRMLDRAI
ncbi:uncharacterized protein PGTG_03541 [Puccinia graminis f. sp. tritici CRL 75-36-700-3]|uniref:Hap4 transcription factor heteromerisation domain-containing protein n=1 Tax=Puccinia graminis f. sp. tritici (strain CRL 75-36-700-3 / race SCCL) TaxID=418459 RepID=E3JZW0_PUCGT|nr:uncharacterized protein PGTG_03541 [Puccinia graminis f. sp. tritici CRL 75-36-700-3]EFP77585.1 hypothetical protein PGTG_03541 [Puccinia graminis f. sp. tritici CRL 75-36-700-3]